MTEPTEIPPGSTPPASPPTPPAPAPLPPAYARPPAPPAPPRGRAASFWVAIVLTILLLLSLLLNVVLIGATLAVVGASQVSSTQRYYTEKPVEGAGADKIVIIDVDGIISSMRGSALFGGRQSMCERVTRQLRQAAEDSSVKAVILAVNSPGGTVTASDVIWNEVRKTQLKGKKVVVQMEDVCASGGYYISASADWIMASPTTITGSIGVIFNTLDASELLVQKLGIREMPVKSGQYKDMGSISRPMTDEERKILQGMIDGAYDRFLDVIAKGRNGHASFTGATERTRAAIKQLADGRIYSGQQAADNGLADATGYLEDTIAKAKALAGMSTARVVRYVRVESLADFFSGNFEGRMNINAGVQVDLNRLLDDGLPKLEYRWRPGI